MTPFFIFEEYEFAKFSPFDEFVLPKSLWFFPEWTREESAIKE